MITMVVDGEQVASVLLDGGVLDGARPGLLCVDMSTVDPLDTERIGAALAGRRVTLLDAPVTGSSPRAADGTLTIMVGRRPRRLRSRAPRARIMGETIVHVGAAGDR